MNPITNTGASPLLKVLMSRYAKKNPSSHIKTKIPKLVPPIPKLVKPIPHIKQKKFGL